MVGLYLGPDVMNAICFDLDGTLTDPKLGVTRSIRYAMEKLNRVAPDEDELTWCIGPPLVECFKKLLGDEHEALAALSFYRERFSEIGIYENVLYAGIRETLATLADDGRRLFVATSNATVFAERIIDYFDLSQYFEAVCGSELDGTRTDKTELLAWLLKEKRLEPAVATMVGDRGHDIVGARNNGMATIGVLYGYGTESELIEAGAAKLCGNPNDLTIVLS